VRHEKRWQVRPYGGVIRFTLDTSIVIAADKRQTVHDLESIDRLIELGHQGSITLQLTEAYERDFSRYDDHVGRQQRLGWLQQNPITEHRSSGAFRLGVSVLDGNDILIDSDEATLNDQLIAILGVRGQSVAKAYSDIDHLLAHSRSKADAFITVDESTILNRRHALALLGITVLSPAEAVSRVLTSQPL